MKSRKKPIDLSMLGALDELEYDCWVLIKAYAKYFNIKIVGKFSENNVSWDLAKQVQDTVLDIFEKAGVQFIFSKEREVLQ